MGKKDAVTIDVMKKEDVDQVLAIEQMSFSSHWSRNLFLSEFRNPAISNLLVSLNGGPVRSVTGFIIFWIIEDEMHILNLAVTPALRRQGVARNLVLHSIRQAHRKGVRRAFLEVRVSNTTAQNLYSHLGFAATFVRRDYYDGPIEDAIVMTLDGQAFLNAAAAAS